jgi:chromosome segregation ATPase
MTKKLIILALFLTATNFASAQDLSIFFLKNGSIFQGNVINENNHRLFLKTEQGTIKIQLSDIIGRESLAKKGDLSFMNERLDYLQNNIKRLMGRVNHLNDSLSTSTDNLFEEFKKINALQNEFEIDLLRLHSKGREQKKQIKNIQENLGNQGVAIASNRQDLGGIEDTLNSLIKDFRITKQKLDVTVSQSYLISGTVSNIKSELQKTQGNQQNQQNQIDIISGSLANLIQEVKKVHESFSSIENHIELNRISIIELDGKVSKESKEINSTMLEMRSDFNQQIRKINKAINNNEKMLAKTDERILTNTNSFKDETSNLKNAISILNKDINLFKSSLKNVEKKVDKLSTQK